MTTPKPSATTASKLANSVRRAKVSNLDEEVLGDKVIPAVKQSVAKKPSVRKVQKPKKVEETVTPMPSCRVWPD